MQITMWDEASDSIVESQAVLNLQNGQISDIVYVPLHDFYNNNKNERPFNSHDYEGTVASITLNGKTIDFIVNTDNDLYQVDAKELKILHNAITELGFDVQKLASDNQKKIKP